MFFMKSNAFSFYPECLLSVNTTECLNLRPDPTGAPALTAVGKPAKAAPAGHIPLLYFSTPEGMLLLTCLGDELYITDDKNNTTHAGCAGSKPLCALYAGDSLHVMTESGIRTLSYPGFKMLPALQAENYPAICLRAVAGPRNLRADVGARTLSGNYRQESTLSEADARAVGADIRNAYATLASEALAQGVMMQPALARYTLLDSGGHTLFTSPPVLLGTSQCLRPLRLECGSDGLLQGYTLSADTWRPELTVPQHGFEAVHSVRVSLTPQLQPVDADATPEIRLTHQAAATTVIVKLKGSATAVDTQNPAGARRTIEEITARMDMAERTVANIAAAPGTTEIECSPGTMPAEELASLRKVLSRPVTEAGMNATTMAPHSFAARCCAAAGDTALWGNISPHRYAGYPAGVLAASTEKRAWKAFVSVEFAGGNERTVWTGEGDTDAPVMFGPLLSYPSPDAVRMTIGVRAEGRTQAVQSFALTPAPGERAAIYVHPSLAPFALTENATGYSVPETVTAAKTLPDTIIATDTATPTVALAMRSGFGTEIKSVLPATSSTASWDFGRTRFYVFGLGGIYTAALNSARDTLVAGQLDKRRVESRDAVTSAADGGVYAMAGGDLLKVGQHSTSTLLAGCGYRALAWDKTHAELWCFANEAMTDVLCTAGKSLRKYRRDTGAATSVLSGECGAFIVTDTGVLALHREARSLTRVAWRGHVAPAGGKRCGMRGVLLHAAGSNLHMDIGLYASGMLAAEPDATLLARLRGQLRSAIRLRTAMRHVRHIEISAEGTAGPDFTLSRIDLL